MDSGVRSRIQVLLVIGEPPALLAVRALLSAECDVIACRSATAALYAMGMDPGRFDVVCADATLPDLTGLQLLERANNGADALGRVLLTDSAGEHPHRHASAWSLPLSIVQKPYRPSDLVTAIVRAGRVARAMRSALAELRLTGS